jgi:hypothetical protein
VSSGLSHPAISIQPSRNIHAEHSQDEPSREHVQIVQLSVTYQPEYSVEDGENGNDDNSVGRKRAAHGLPAFRPLVPLVKLPGVRWVVNEPYV